MPEALDGCSHEKRVSFYLFTWYVFHKVGFQQDRLPPHGEVEEAKPIHQNSVDLIGIGFNL
jgi:hypothetical protein